ncbi:hypothetical protein L596_026258 [Steinernema carpocapsae]|nr:hypothetical protein L596_026258 [Steinernema carpocapsae]
MARSAKSPTPMPGVQVARQGPMINGSARSPSMSPSPASQMNGTPSRSTSLGPPQGQYQPSPNVSHNVAAVNGAQINGTPRVIKLGNVLPPGQLWHLKAPTGAEGQASLQGASAQPAQTVPQDVATLIRTSASVAGPSQASSRVDHQGRSQVTQSVASPNRASTSATVSAMPPKGYTIVRSVSRSPSQSPSHVASQGLASPSQAASTAPISSPAPSNASPSAQSTPNHIPTSGVTTPGPFPNSPSLLVRSGNRTSEFSPASRRVHFVPTVESQELSPETKQEEDSNDPDQALMPPPATPVVPKHINGMEYYDNIKIFGMAVPTYSGRPVNWRPIMSADCESALVRRYFLPPDVWTLKKIASCVGGRLEAVMPFGFPKDFSIHSPPLTCYDVESDGNCLFRAISLYLLGSEAYFRSFRKLAVDTVEVHKTTKWVDDIGGGSNNPPIEQRLSEMRKDARHLNDHARWGGSLEMIALALALDMNIYCYEEDNINKRVWQVYAPEMTEKTSFLNLTLKKRFSIALLHGKHHFKTVVAIA